MDPAVPRWKILVFLGLAAAMVALPAKQLVAEDPRFGWRMFSFVQAFPTFSLVDEAGTEEVIDGRRYVARLRGDVAFAEVLPQHLCAVHPEAALIVVELDGERDEVVCP